MTSKKKIALLLPPFANIYGRFRILYKSGFLNPPLSFTYLASSLEKQGHAVMIIDGEAEGLTSQEMLSRIARFEPDLIGFSVTSPTYDETVRFASQVKSTFPAIPTVVGGVHIAIFQKIVLEETPAFDFGVIGDGEDALPELVERLGEPSAFSEVKGLVWRSDSEVIQNEFRPSEKNIDRYPFPARHLLRNELYIRNIPYKGYKVTAAFMASRGCPYNCIYCAVKNIPNGTMARFRSPENIMVELKSIVTDLGINHIAFNDDCLTMRRENVYALCEAIQKSSLDFTWEGFSRADRLDREMLRAMKRSGFNRISIGIESGNQRILEVLQKNETLEVIAEAIQIAHEEGIVTRGSLIIGSPYETRKDVEDTFRFITTHKGLDQAVINIMQPYPGTKVREMVLHGEGGTRLVALEFSALRRYGNASFEVNDLTAASLVRLQRQGMRRFYFKPQKMIRNLVINHPAALARDAVGALLSIVG